MAVYCIISKIAPAFTSKSFSISFDVTGVDDAMRKVPSLFTFNCEKPSMQLNVIIEIAKINFFIKLFVLI